MIAVIRLRGRVEVGKEIQRTLDMLRLSRVNHCVLLPKTPSNEGMLKKAKRYIAWGEVDPKVVEKLIAKRGRKTGDKKLTAEEAKKAAEKLSKGEKADVKPVFRLNSPSGGFKSKRRIYPRGDLGKVGAHINNMLRKMI